MRCSILFLSFVVYSFLGWLYESLVWAPCEKKRFINRGYLIGPWCPIYGFVSLLDWYLLSEIESPLKIFIVAMLVCCAFEYAVSFLLEKVFHERWWDYSNYPLNLNGRISLFSALLFGFAGLALVQWVHPFVYGHLSLIPPPWIGYCAELFLFLFAADTAVTTIGLSHKNTIVEKFYDKLNYTAEMPFDYLTEHTEPVREKAEETIKTAAGTATETLTKVADTASETLRSAAGTAAETLTKVAETASEKLAKAADSATQTITKVSEKLSSGENSSSEKK